MSELKNANLWIVMADGAQAKILTPDSPTGRFFTTLVYDATVTYRPQAPTHHLDPLAKTKFARTMAKRIEDAARNAEFDALVLIAPGHFQHDLRAKLSRETDALIVGTETKDLMKLPHHERDEHLARWWHPPSQSA
jgi:hypothetical protein